MLGKWLELPQLLLTETGFCSACSSTNARLDAVMFGEGLVLVTSGDISCFRQSGRDCRGSEVVTASGQADEKMKRNGEWNYKLSMSEMSTMNKRAGGFGTLVHWCVWLESACGSKGSI